MNDDLETQVHEALEKAEANLYFMDNMSDAEIADDLIRYDAGLEDRTVEELLPYIRSWKIRRQ